MPDTESPPTCYATGRPFVASAQCICTACRHHRRKIETRSVPEIPDNSRPVPCLRCRELERAATYQPPTAEELREYEGSHD